MIASVESAPQSHIVPAVTRVNSIDILRALTMVLMIFVNDLWSLTNVPNWLLHTTADEDGMGLSDVIFPAFLFIVGMSIPFAVRNRKKKGETKGQILLHMLMRGLALLVMGLFLVNGENLNEEASGITRMLYNSLVCLSFILIWNAYSTSYSQTVSLGLRIIGIAVLLFIAFKVRGGEDAARFSIYWWGILGLIGWSYIVCSALFTLIGERVVIIGLTCLAFLALSMLSRTGVVSLDSFSFVMDPLSNGSLAFLTMAGVFSSMLFIKIKDTGTPARTISVFTGIGLVLIFAGLYTNKFWIIAKLGATPPWILLCSGLTILAFTSIYWIADVQRRADWFQLFKPAGTNTLICYLLPYFAYALVDVLNIDWPPFMLNGIVGLLKSFLFSLLCVVVAGGLQKAGVQLKL
jgi:heparan-alpha-glucosaminide N-acetyltransferase